MYEFPFVEETGKTDIRASIISVHASAPALAQSAIALFFWTKRSQSLAWAISSPQANVGGSTFWEWCAPGTGALQRAVFEYEYEDEDEEVHAAWGRRRPLRRELCIPVFRRDHRSTSRNKSLKIRQTTLDIMNIMLHYRSYRVFAFR